MFPLNKPVEVCGDANRKISHKLTFLSVRTTLVEMTLSFNDSRQRYNGIYRDFCSYSSYVFYAVCWDSVLYLQYLLCILKLSEHYFLNNGHTLYMLWSVLLTHYVHVMDILWSVLWTWNLIRAHTFAKILLKFNSSEKPSYILKY